MIGDPPNIIIGNAIDELDFVDFMRVLAPGVILMSPVCLYLLRFLYRGKLDGKLERYNEVLELASEYKIHQPDILYKTCVVLGTAIVAFLLHPLHHVNVAWIAIFGAVVLMVITSPHSIHHDLEAVEWDTLLFFAGLFVMVEGMGEVGLIRAIGDVLTNLIEGVEKDSR